MPLAPYQLLMGTISLGHWFLPSRAQTEIKPLGNATSLATARSTPHSPRICAAQYGTREALEYKHAALVGRVLGRPCLRTQSTALAARNAACRPLQHSSSSKC
eukprot:6203128-Pleurochrysis_carterae.AAC.3